MPMGDGDSRVLLNFSGSVDAIMTLAHELGHAYHNSTMVGRTPMQRGTPSSLAETASIFCETIMVGHGIATARDDAERLAILEVDLQGATQVIVDIHSRFLFESAVFERRATSTLSADELLRAHGRGAGGRPTATGSHPDQRHPWMWAAKPHYYGSLFYNWPYAFGLLFGLGLYARFQEDPDRFRHGYDDLLSSTGLGQRRRPRRPASTSTCATRASGRRASTSSAAGSTSSARSPDADVSDSPASAVSTSAPSSVTRMVCSNWAVRLRSMVTAVQPSSHIWCSWAPMVIIGSMVNVMPGSIERGEAGLVVVRDVDVGVELLADAVADERPDHAEAVATRRAPGWPGR